MSLRTLVQVTQDLGIDMAIPVSVKLGELGNVFQRIVNAGQQPHLSIPETEASRYRKHCQLVFKSSLMAVSGISLVSFFFFAFSPTVGKFSALLY